MPFNQKQRRMLAAKLNARHVKAREARGAILRYIEGWHAIAEANRIFGYEHWDRQTLSTQCVWQDRRRGGHACLYTARVRISVRAGATTVVREGSGSGTGYAADAGGAHDIALKAAETDATKRALATFGNPFGLALYDKEHAGVRGRMVEPQAPSFTEAPEFTLRPAQGPARTFTDPKDFAAALDQALRACATTGQLFGLWERHLDEIIVLKAYDATTQGPKLVDQLITGFKQRARDMFTLKAEHAGDGARRAKVPEPEEKTGASGNGPTRQARAADSAASRPPREAANGAAPDEDGQNGEVNGQLPFPKEKRLRDKEHLKYVGARPCLVCGRKPAHAHHLRFAQGRAMGRKVSDEFTVPLCALHHDQLHRTGDEPAWWASRGIDALEVAEKLWRAHRGNDEGV